MPKAEVLVVDDDAVSRHVLCEALTSAGLLAVAVASGEAALEELAQWRPSLVLLDLMMPFPDGYEVLRRIRASEKTRDVPVVVLTALDADDEIERAFEAGADDFLRKPFRAVELIARVRGQRGLRFIMDELAQKERDAKIVLELTQALASNLDFRGILFTVVQRIADVADVDRVSIVLVRDQGDVGYVVAASDDEQLRDLPIELSKYPEIRETLKTGFPLVIADTNTHPSLELLRDEAETTAQRHSNFGFRSLALLPITYEGKPMGVLFLRAHRASAFGTREVSLCSTVSSAMAIALRNARVLQSLRDQTQQVTVARFEAERRLKSLQRYADFFESSADGILVMDAEGRLLFTNPKARSITGYSEAETDGRAFHDFFAAMDASHSLASLFEGFRNDVFPQDLDMRIRAKDGRAVIASVNVTSVAREEGVVLCSFRDVTQDRAVEGELVKTKESLERVIDSSFDAIVSADMSGAITLFNRAAERLTGHTSEAVLGKNVRILYPHGVAETIMRSIKQGSGRIEGLRVDVLDSAGRAVPVTFSGALIHEHDAAIGSVGIFTDMREKMRMERRLQMAQEQLLEKERQAIVAELAGAAAHELNQPLQSVMAYAELMRRKLAPDSPGYSAAEVIHGEAERMAEIVRKIGRITRYETKSYVGEQRILDLDRASGEPSDRPSDAARASSKPPSSSQKMAAIKDDFKNS
jgi:PAS domain S-box-containing protein